MAKARLLDLKGSPTQVMLPGFTPFTDAGGVRASDWTVPGRITDLDEVLAVYEDYVDRPFGKYNRPDRIARSVAQGPVVERFFGRNRGPLEWWIPAVQLIAIASRLTDTPADVAHMEVKLETDEFKMHVRPDGCWSNTHQRMATTKNFASDACMEELTVDPLVTDHPLAQALVGIALPRPVLMAANAVVRCEIAGAIDKVRPIHLEWVPTRRHSNKRKVNAVNAAGALTALREEVDLGDATFRDLQLIAVPALMTIRMFNQVVGSANLAPDRRLSPMVAARLTEYLDLMEGLHEAV